MPLSGRQGPRHSSTAALPVSSAAGGGGGADRAAEGVARPGAGGDRPARPPAAGPDHRLGWASGPGRVPQCASYSRASSHSLSAESPWCGSITRVHLVSLQRCGHGGAAGQQLRQGPAPGPNDPPPPGRPEAHLVQRLLRLRPAQQRWRQDWKPRRAPGALHHKPQDLPHTFGWTGRLRPLTSAARG